MKFHHIVLRVSCIFEFIEAAFYDVTKRINCTINRKLDKAVALGRDHRISTALLHVIANKVGVISLIGLQHLGGRAFGLHDGEVAFIVGDFTTCENNRYGHAKCIDVEINGENFLDYVEHLLVPTLKPEDIVIMDNLGSHKGDAVRNAIRSTGARLFFLPSYGRDLNPIEQAFSKLKHGLRKAKG